MAGFVLGDHVIYQRSGQLCWAGGTIISAQNNSWSLANFRAIHPNGLAKQLMICQSLQ